jgi:molybdopterin/thiamine biosynthesis adenylyltransferase
MRRTLNNLSSSFGREVAVRLSRSAAEVLGQHMRQDTHQEQMAFGLGYHAKTADGTVLLVKDLMLPGKADLGQQSSGGISPSRQFQGYVYFRAEQTMASIVEFHTHPGGGVPSFSGVDDTNGHRNAEYISRKLPAPVTLAMVVANNRFDAFDAVIYDKCIGRFRQVDRIEVLGRPTAVYLVGKSMCAKAIAGGQFDRQQRIPGWNQHGLEHQRIGVIGAGGNGAWLLQTLVGIGAGRQGSLTIADPDRVDETNLPRLPYAFAEHVGIPKVSLAAQYAGLKSPGTPVFAFPCRFSETAVLSRMKSATVLFYCGDNDGGRKEATEFAVRYGIPLIETGCDIQVSEESVAAGGQVRVVLPGENACLVCCRGFDPSQAAIDQMDDAGRARHAAGGYVQGAEGTATPSVANLNAMTAQHAVSAFLALVNGGDFARWDFLHFDQFTGRTIPASSGRREDCPLCGPEGYLFAGDPFQPLVSDQPPIRPLEIEARQALASS